MGLVFFLGLGKLPSILTSTKSAKTSWLVWKLSTTSTCGLWRLTWA